MKKIAAIDHVWVIMFLSSLICFTLFCPGTVKGQLSFSLEGPITITSSASDLSVGDFNNSGRLEAVITHAQNYNSTTPASSNIVSYIKYNTGSSLWEASVIENTGGYASWSITSGDYDGDGNRDFAFTSYCNCGNYYLYKGNGAGTFANATPTFSGNRFSYDMITGELNNDGKPDILTGGNTVLSKFLNTSAGTNNFSFSKTSFIITSSDNSSYGYAMGLFNTDGYNDVVAAVPAEAKVRVFINDGTGGINSAVYSDYSIAGSSTSNIRGVASGDFNDDGFADMVAASYTGNAIGVLINTGDGTGVFNPVLLYTITTPSWVEIGDFNLDGFADIAVAADNISIFFGNGDGTFSSTPYVYPLTGVRRLKVADIDNDGRDDIAAITSNTFRVLINKTGSYSISETDDVCSGSSYTFADGTTENNILSQIVHVSNLISVQGYDSVITTTLHVNPIYNQTETDIICSGYSYTFPDGTTQNNITSQVVHSSHFTTVNGCDSIITTTVNVNPVYNTSEAFSICHGDPYTFPDGTTQNNITAQVVHSSNLTTVNGCDSIITTTVNVNPVYNTNEAFSICHGDPYTFPDGTTQNNITAQVVHTSYLASVNGCDSIITTTVDVIMVEVGVLQNGVTLTANANGAIYQWLNCSNFTEIIGETIQSFTPLTNGDYAVEIEQNGCIDTSACISITGVGISSIGFEASIAIYPNPTDGMVNINLGNTVDGVFVRLRDIIGQIIEEKDFSSENDISICIDKPAGCYFIEIYTTSGESAVFKVVKE